MNAQFVITATPNALMGMYAKKEDADKEMPEMRRYLLDRQENAKEETGYESKSHFKNQLENLKITTYKSYKQIKLGEYING